VIDRPGPVRLLPGLAPGGLVVRVYTLADEMLLEDRLTIDMDLEERAERSASFVAALTDECYIVVYDGDTGERVSVERMLGNLP
jgi:hypothetical protein